MNRHYNPITDREDDFDPCDDGRDCPARGAPLSFDGEYAVCTDDDCHYVEI